MTKQSPPVSDPYAPPQQDGDEVAAAPAFTGEQDPERPLVLRYRYVARLGKMLLALLFFAGCLAFYVWRAGTNDRGLIINGLIELGTSGATRFFAAFALASGGFVLIGLWALAAHFRAPSYLVLDETALSIPSRFGRKPRSVPYAAIRGVRLTRVQGQSMLQITTDGRNATLAAIMLASDAQLHEVAELLIARVRDAQQTP
jgi:hypothetical protein